MSMQIYFIAAAAILFSICAIYLVWDALEPVRRATRRRDREMK